MTILVIAFAVNLPLGYLRKGARKFSLAWFVYIHLSIPLIAYLRITRGVPLISIPLFIIAAVLGQFSGGAIRGEVAL
ncbi:MAG: hypothetical protein D6713_09195 [Deltaproteobacteria bacterium]|nr:MAG: hypothetical protein D6713_09195 [Deltaproteobacteria bacterium]